jgi:hypothetical protein
VGRAGGQAEDAGGTTASGEHGHDWTRHLFDSHTEGTTLGREVHQEHSGRGRRGRKVPHQREADWQVRRQLGRTRRTDRYRRGHARWVGLEHFTRSLAVF